MDEKIRLGLCDAMDALLVVQAQLLALQRMIESEAVAAGGECKHPADARADISSPGHRGFHCRACGQIVEEAENGEACPS